MCGEAKEKKKKKFVAHRSRFMSDATHFSFSSLRRIIYFKEEDRRRDKRSDKEEEVKIKLVSTS